MIVWNDFRLIAIRNISYSLRNKNSHSNGWHSHQMLFLRSHILSYEAHFISVSKCLITYHDTLPFPLYRVQTAITFIYFVTLLFCFLMVNATFNKYFENILPTPMTDWYLKKCVILATHSNSDSFVFTER